MVHDNTHISKKKRALGYNPRALFFDIAGGIAPGGFCGRR